MERASELDLLQDFIRTQRRQKLLKPHRVIAAMWPCAVTQPESHQGKAVAGINKVVVGGDIVATFMEVNQQTSDVAAGFAHTCPAPID